MFRRLAAPLAFGTTASVFALKSAVCSPETNSWPFDAKVNPYPTFLLVINSS